MKKNFIRVASVAAFVAIAGYGIYYYQRTTGLSDLALSNIEALANDDESGLDVYCCGNYGTCMYILGGGEVKGIKFFTPCP